MQEKKLTSGNFSQRLASLMSERDVKASDVASATGITPAALSRYLSGQREPRYAEAQKLADFFCLNTDYLLNPERYSSPLREAAAIAKEVGGPSQNAIFEITERELRADIVREEPLSAEMIDWRRRALLAEGKLEAVRRELIGMRDANERIEKLCKPDKEEKR